MAERLLSQYICISDSEGNSTFSLNDIIAVYADDTADDFKVYLNDVVITSNSGVIYETYVDVYDYFFTPAFSASGITFKNNKLLSGYSLCEGTTLVQFEHKASFPYAKRLETLNSSICNNTTCDIAQIGIIDVINETSLGAADGSISFKVYNSLGSNVRTELSDFSYPNSSRDMTQSGNYWLYTYSGLTSGVYSIYCVDNNGCRTSFNAEIEPKNTYGVRYFWEFKDNDDNEFRVDVLERNYEGSSTEKTYLGSDGAILSLNGSGRNLLEPIKSSSLTVPLYNLTNAEFDDLIVSSDEEKYIVKLYNKPSSTFVLMWQGLLTPEVYTEPYQEPPYTGTITAIDRLQDLADHKFILTGDDTIFNILKFCLGKLNIPNGFRLAVNIYEDSQNQTSSDDPFTQTSVNLDSFFQDNNNPDCYSVISQILKVFAARLFSYQGYWYVTRIQEAGESSIDYREYTSEGSYVGNGSLSPLVSVKQASESDRAIWRYGGVTRALGVVYNNVNVIEDREITPSVMKGFFLENSIDKSEDRPSGFVGWNFAKRFVSGDWVIDDNTAVGLYVNRTRTRKSITELSHERGGGGVGSAGRVRRGGAYVYRGETLLVEREADLVSVLFDPVDKGYVVRSDFDDDGLGASYITYSMPVEFNNNDSFQMNVPFKVLVKFARYELSNPYLQVKWSIYINLIEDEESVTRWLNSNGEWIDSEQINEYWCSEYNSDQDYTVSAGFPDVSETTATELTVRLYDVSWKSYDYVLDNESGIVSSIAAIPTAELTEGNRLIYKATDTDRLYYYTLDKAGFNEPSNNIDNIGASDNSFLRWRIEQRVSLQSNYETSIEYQSVYFMTFPNSIKIEDEEVITKTLVKASRVIDYQLKFFDLDQSINNSEQLILNYLKLNDGSPTSGWGGKKIQEVLADALAIQYQKPRNIITGKLRTDILFNFYSALYDETDGNKKYTVNKLTLNLRNSEISGEFNEIEGDKTVIARSYEALAYSNGYN